jgi:hypothetical protein
MSDGVARRGGGEGRHKLGCKFEEVHSTRIEIDVLHKVVRDTGFRRVVWPSVPLLLCSFHFKQTWALNLKQRVSTDAMKEIIADLDRLSRFNESHPVLNALQQAKAQIDAFLLKHKDAGTFADYFKKQWANRPGEVHSCCL